MAVAAATTSDQPRISAREASRARAIRRFRWSILAPLIALFALVLMPVLFLQLYFSFHQWTVYLGSWWDAEFVGLDLFQEVFTDPRFGWAIVRSLGFATGSTVGCFVLGFALAYLMYKPFRGPGVLLRHLHPADADGADRRRLHGGDDAVPERPDQRHHQPPAAASSSSRRGSPIRRSRMLAVTLLEIWNWTPFSFIIMLAGLSAIPKEPIEAAQILGASRWRIFWEVQLPLLRPVILLALVLRFLEAMAEFPKTWALFQGGPGTATETIPVYIFLTTWQYFQISKGAALSYVAMMLMIVIVLLAIRLLRREKRALDAMYAKPEPDGAADDQVPKRRRITHDRALRASQRVGDRRVLPDLLDGLRPRSSPTPSGSRGRRSTSPTRRPSPTT